jgi:hypothetical protein
MVGKHTFITGERKTHDESESHRIDRTCMLLFDDRRVETEVAPEDDAA